MKQKDKDLARIIMLCWENQSLDLLVRAINMHKAVS